MRRRFNGFDILVAVLIIVGLLLVARKAVHRTGTTSPQHTVVFTVTSTPTQYASQIAQHLAVGGTVKVSAAGAYVPMGTLTSYKTVPYVSTASTQNGKLMQATNPVLNVVQLQIVGKASVSQKTVQINGNPFLVGQQTIFQEGGSQFVGMISDEQVQ